MRKIEGSNGIGRIDDQHRLSPSDTIVVAGDHDDLVLLRLSPPARVASRPKSAGIRVMGDARHALVTTGRRLILRAWIRIGQCEREGFVLGCDASFCPGQGREQ